jgi:hypothetical protein
LFIIKTEQMKKFTPRSQKGKDTIAFIESIEDKDLTGRERLDLISKFSDSWEENQLPDGIKIITNSFGLPEIELNN